MFNKFKKKPELKPEPKPEPKKYYFEKEDIPKLYKYLDKFEKTRLRIDKYKMWKFIYTCFDLDAQKDYEIRAEHPLKPYIKECL